MLLAMHRVPFSDHAHALSWAVVAAAFLHVNPAPAQVCEGNAETSDAAGSPRTRGHAHNDYLHERPLLEALDRRFASVEADIFLCDGQLLVGHTRVDLRPERTLESMYLRPLAEWVARRAGGVHAPQRPLILVIDVKTDGESTWAALHPILLKYRELVSETVDGEFQPRAVSVVISGNRATEKILGERPQLAGVDGRLSDLDSPLRADEMPLVSDQWSRHFQWRGNGPMPAEESKKLRDVVAKAHAAGRMVRFWATPETVTLWQELQTAGVDLIGTDHLDRLEAFLELSADANPAADTR